MSLFFSVSPFIFAVFLEVFRARESASGDREGLEGLGMKAYPTVNGSLQVDLRKLEGAVSRVSRLRLSSAATNKSL